MSTSYGFLPPCYSQTNFQRAAQSYSINKVKTTKRDNYFRFFGYCADIVEDDDLDLVDPDTYLPETQMQRAKRLGLKVDADKVFENEKGETTNSLPKAYVRRSQLNIYIPQAEREPHSAKSSRRGTPDSGIIDDNVSSVGRQTPHVIVTTKEAVTEIPPEGADVSVITDEKSNATRRPASSFTGLRRGQLEGERLKAERPHTAHVRFKAEDLQSAFEEALKRYQNLPGTPAEVSPEKLYKNDGVSFEDNWQERIIERHTLLRMQKEIRAQSAAQRRQAIEMIQKDKQTSKQFPSRCDSAIGGFSEMTAPASARTTTSMSVPISMGYGVNKGSPQTRESIRPKTANPVLEKQQMHKSELSHEKAFRYRLSQNGAPAMSRPSSSKSIPSVADFSPHWIDPRNPDAWRPKSSRSIPSKCNRYVLVNKPKEKLSAPIPSPLEEQLLIERFPKMGSKVVQALPPNMPQIKKSFSLEYSPFVYPRIS